MIFQLISSSHTERIAKQTHIFIRNIFIKSIANSVPTLSSRNETETATPIVGAFRRVGEEGSSYSKTRVCVAVPGVFECIVIKVALEACKCLDPSLIVESQVYWTDGRNFSPPIFPGPIDAVRSCLNAKWWRRIPTANCKWRSSQLWVLMVLLLSRNQKVWKIWAFSCSETLTKISTATTTPI